MSENIVTDRTERAAIRVELVVSLERLFAVRDEYHALLEKSAPNRSFFYQLDVLKAMAPFHTGGRRSLFFLLAYESDMLVGLLPLVLERKPLSRAGLKVLSLWGGDGSAAGVEGELPISPTADVRRVLLAFREALAGALAHHFDVIELGYLRADSPVRAPLEQLFADAEFTEEPASAHHTETGNGFASYHMSRSTGRLRELRRLKRRLEEQYSVLFRIASSLTARDAEQIAALHNARQGELGERGWQREALFGDALKSDAVFAALSTASTSATARHYFLEVDGHMVAFLLTLCVGNTQLAWITAVDSQFAAFSPGGLLFWYAVEDAFARGEVQRVEFGPGTTFVKETVCTHALRPVHMRWIRPASQVSRFRVALYYQLVRIRQLLRR